MFSGRTALTGDMSTVIFVVNETTAQGGQCRESGMSDTIKVGACVPAEEYRELKAILARRRESLQNWLIRKIREEIPPTPRQPPRLPIEAIGQAASTMRSDSPSRMWRPSCQVPILNRSHILN
jgi:hypothetical protein